MQSLKVSGSLGWSDVQAGMFFFFFQFIYVSSVVSFMWGRRDYLFLVKMVGDLNLKFEPKGFSKHFHFQYWLKIVAIGDSRTLHSGVSFGPQKQYQFNMVMLTMCINYYSSHWPDTLQALSDELITKLSRSLLLYSYCFNWVNALAFSGWGTTLSLNINEVSW